VRQYSGQKKHKNLYAQKRHLIAYATDPTAPCAFLSDVIERIIPSRVAATGPAIETLVMTLQCVQLRGILAPLVKPHPARLGEITRLLTRVVVLLLPLAALLLRSAGIAYASCNPGRTPNNYLHYYWDGMSRDPPSGNPPGGVRAYIVTYSPYVPSGDDSTTAWVLLTDNTYTQYAQIGWWQAPGNVRKTFAEWTYDAGAHFHDDYFSPFAVGSEQRYSVRDNRGDITFLVNGKLYDETTQNWTTHEAQILGEIHTRSAQVPGGINDADFLGGAHIEYPWGSANWYDFRGTSGITSDKSTYIPPWMGQDPYRSGPTNDVFIWDKACTTRHG
jgi:hypothetical protein